MVSSIVIIALVAAAIVGVFFADRRRSRHFEELTRTQQITVIDAQNESDAARLEAFTKGHIGWH